MWATTASYALGAVVSVLLQRGGVSLPIPWTAVARSGLATGVMALAVSRLPASGGVGELAAKALLGGIVYGLAALALDAGHARSHAVRALGALRVKMAARGLPA